MAAAQGKDKPCRRLRTVIHVARATCSLGAPQRMKATLRLRCRRTVYKAVSELPPLLLHTAHLRLEPWNVPLD
jgi:hypothetical protein